MVWLPAPTFLTGLSQLKPAPGVPSVPPYWTFMLGSMPIQGFHWLMACRVLTWSQTFGAAAWMRMDCSYVHAVPAIAATSRNKTIMPMTMYRMIICEGFWQINLENLILIFYEIFWVAFFGVAFLCGFGAGHAAEFT